MKTLHNFSVKEKNVLLRVDLNVPVKDGVITDKTRLYAIKKTVHELISKNNKIFLLSHFGRPKGKYNQKYSLEFLKSILEEILSVEKIHFLPSYNEREVRVQKNIMEPGDICLLENVRFNEGEEQNDLNFAKVLAGSFNVYINDAFSASHRQHASIAGITKYLPSLAGKNLVKELKNIDMFLANPIKPTTSIIGGSKVSTKLLLLNNLIKIFDNLVICGAIANTFLLAKGNNVGKSFVEEDLIQDAIRILENSKNFNTNIILPVDLVCSNSIYDTHNIKQVDLKNILPNQIAFDVGENTIKLIKKTILKSNTVLWNGPLGAFENKPFDKATNEIANVIKKNAKKYNIIAIAGGGETVAAIKKAKAEDSFTYISSAGGAFLEWLEGKESPGIKALKENNFS